MSRALKKEQYKVITDLQGIPLRIEAVRFGNAAWNITATLQIDEIKIAEIKLQPSAVRIWDALREAEDAVLGYL